MELGGVLFPLDEEKNARLAANGAEAGEITLGVRPEHITVASEGEHMLRGTVDVGEMMGSSIHLHVRSLDQDVIIIVQTMDLKGTHLENFTYGQEIAYSFSGSVMHLFDKATGENLAK